MLFFSFFLKEEKKERKKKIKNGKKERKNKERTKRKKEKRKEKKRKKKQRKPGDRNLKKIGRRGLQGRGEHPQSGEPHSKSATTRSQNFRLRPGAGPSGTRGRPATGKRAPVLLEVE